MTKAAALLLAGSMALAACASDEKSGNSGGGDAGAGELKIGLAYDAIGRGDKSFNDSAFAGAEAAIKEFGGEYREVTPNEDGSDRAELLAQLAFLPALQHFGNAPGWSHRWIGGGQRRIQRTQQ